MTFIWFIVLNNPVSWFERIQTTSLVANWNLSLHSLTFYMLLIFCWDYLILVIDFLVQLALLLENTTLFDRQLLFAKSCIFLVLSKWCSPLNYFALLLNIHKLNKQFHWRNDVLCRPFTLRSCRSQFDKISDPHFVKWRKPNRNKLKYCRIKKFIWMVTIVFHQHADSKVIGPPYKIPL